MTENERDISLLQTDPNALVLKYQQTIRIIVERSVKADLLSPRDVKDTIQTVNLGLLERIPAIIKNYDGRALLVTYISAIIRNICLHLHNKPHVQTLPLGTKDPDSYGADAIFNRLAIQEALEGFSEVMETYCRDKPKLVLLLKLYFNVPLDEETVLRTFPQASPEDVCDIVGRFGGGVALKQKIELFDQIAPFLNRMEGKKTAGDGYLHWVVARIPEILRLLSTRLRLETLGTETLRALVEEMTLRSPGQK